MRIDNYCLRDYPFQYTAEKAALTVELCEISYCREGKDNAIERALDLGFNKVHFIENKETDTQVMIVADPETMVIVFRGSSTKADWVTNFNYSQTLAYDKYKIHEGFYKAAMSVREDLESWIKTMIYYGGRNRLIITGHSLGAALAGVYSIDPNLWYYADEVWMHASPRWAAPGMKFLKFAVKNDNGVFRTQNNNDIVCRVPLPVMIKNKCVYLYKHYGKRIYITESGKIKLKSGPFFRIIDRVWGNIKNIKDIFKKKTQTRALDMIDDHHPAYYYDAFAKEAGQVRNWQIWKGHTK